MTQHEKNRQIYYWQHIWSYKCVEWSDFDFHNLSYLPIKHRPGKGNNESYNDIICMADTETSKSEVNKYDKNGKVIPVYNYVVAWSLSIRTLGVNIVTLYGHDPESFIRTLKLLKENLRGEMFYIYFYNLAYDWQFIKKFLFSEFGPPFHQLNTKPRYPILIKFDNGITLKDSLILAQRSLERWSSDMNVEHQKAVGYWDYNKIRMQSDDFTEDEIIYIEHDTLAGVECLDAHMTALGKNVSSIHATATGIPREGVYKSGKRKHAKNTFLKQALDFQQYLDMEKVYHGGFTHCNRHYIDERIDHDLIRELLPEVRDKDVICYDFASSYPFCMFKDFPMSAFEPTDNCSLYKILKHKERYAFYFKLIMLDVILKDDDLPMTPLQFSKCEKTVNVVLDNGRIMKCDYCEIWLNEIDLEVIERYYSFSKEICVNVQFAKKGKLPKWLTDYVFQCFEDKTRLKGQGILYNIAKAKLNSIYGMMVQKALKDNIIEDYDSGAWSTVPNINEDTYQQYLEDRKKILNFQHGCWITSYAFANLFRLGECFNLWLYSDTDSCYGVGVDQGKVDAYNNECRQIMVDAGYGPVRHNDRDYWLGVAELDGSYSEFKMMGAKRYCCRDADSGKLKITIAGVPKCGVVCLNDNIDAFRDGTIFSGAKTGKLTHYYLDESEIKKDKNGNVYADSVDLNSCDYLLSKVQVPAWEELFEQVIEIQTYEEVD